MVAELNKYNTQRKASRVYIYERQGNQKPV